MIFDLGTTKRSRDYISGNCARCNSKVYQSEAILSDAFAVWWGKCLHCGAINGLDFTKGRGYSSQGIYLVLPTEEEVIMNDILPDDAPTRGWENPSNKGLKKNELIELYG